MDKVLSFIQKIMTSEKFIIAAVIINTIVIFIQECKIESALVNSIDVFLMFLFVVEMIVKNKVYGIKKYWTSPLNCMDGIIVLISIPSLITFFIPSFADLSFLFALRIFRTFRFFGLVRYFKDFAAIATNFKLAIRQSYAVVLIFVIIIVTFALMSSCIFSEAAPQYFGTPFDSIYTIFRMFTIEGWYEIPDSITEYYGASWVSHAVRIYFCSLLIVGGIIGMSLINSIFVDAMVSDNNDDLKAQLARVEEKLDKLLAERETALDVAKTPEMPETQSASAPTPEESEGNESIS